MLILLLVLFKEITKHYDAFRQENLKSVRKTIEFIEESGENWSDKFDRLVAGRGVREIVMDNMAQNLERFNVLVHNDLWICNMMFKYPS